MSLLLFYSTPITSHVRYSQNQAVLIEDGAILQIGGKNG